MWCRILIAALVSLGAVAPVSAQQAPQVPDAPKESARPFWILPNTRIVTDTEPMPLQGIRGPRISPDGTRIIFAAVGDLWNVDIDEKALTQGKPPKGRHLIKDEALDFDPAWSPDGTQLAYVSDRSGKPEIWLRDMKTNKERQLTTLTDPVEAPSWSPDSKRIAFFKDRVAGAPGIRSLHVVTVFTGDVSLIRADVRAAAGIAWAPDGESLLLRTAVAAPSPTNANVGKFLLISLKGAADRMVAPAGLSASLARGHVPAWSPDGTKIAYVDRGVLWVAPVTASGPRIGEITGPSRALTTEHADSPSWTGDSKTILYVANDRMKRVTMDGVAQDVQPSLTWKRDVPQGRTVVWAGRLWDGVSQVYRQNVDIIVDDGVITSVEPHSDHDARTRVINASRKTVIPGLIDSRVRLSPWYGERVGRLLLSYGITSVREWGEDPYDALERRESWSSGRRAGPREFFTATLASDSVDLQGKHLTFEAEAANHLGYDLVANDAGVIARLREMNPDGLKSLAIVSDPNPAYAGTTVMPRLTSDGGFLVVAGRDPLLLKNTQFAALYTEMEQKAWKVLVEQGGPSLPALQRRLAGEQSGLRELASRGGRVIFGSGAPVVPYGLGFVVEGVLAQGDGLPTLSILQAMTSGAAAALGVEKEIGTVEAGKLADLVILDGDPLGRIADLAKVSGVLADGHYYIIDELLRH